MAFKTQTFSLRHLWWSWVGVSSKGGSHWCLRMGVGCGQGAPPQKRDRLCTCWGRGRAGPRHGRGGGAPGARAAVPGLPLSPHAIAVLACLIHSLAAFRSWGQDSSGHQARAYRFLPTLPPSWFASCFLCWMSIYCCWSRGKPGNQPSRMFWLFFLTCFISWLFL